jgi:hypothetical protein
MTQKDNFTDVVESLAEQPTLEQDAQIVSEEQQMVNAEGETVTLGGESLDTVEK